MGIVLVYFCERSQSMELLINVEDGHFKKSFSTEKESKGQYGDNIREYDQEVYIEMTEEQALNLYYWLGKKLNVN